ncbi:hypothetical protein [Pseudoalteromonas sp. McH1-42]|uniref:hypothetical protein n=1 Tax=Pseudoalteromonas sp. McH1-42 TaxID=2917752 RepID=UPI001EF438C0|nr:hypothetical protein [Pseudoalteromonas sp. McH1-42]MCG7562560.1 hypothetical protein [Pseudoalteromonas sp. McH1-42]
MQFGFLMRTLGGDWIRTGMSYRGFFTPAVFYTVCSLFVLHVHAFDLNVSIPSKTLCQKLEEGGALAQKAPDLNRLHMNDLFISQLNTFGRCRYKKGKEKEAIEFWLLASSYGSEHGAELAGSYLFNHASSATELLSAMSILRGMGRSNTRALNRFHIQSALAILKGEYFNKSNKLALYNLYTAMKNGSAEAAYLIAYFKETGIFPNKNKQYAEEYWIAIGDKLLGESAYKVFTHEAILSDLYGASLRQLIEK